MHFLINFVSLAEEELQVQTSYFLSKMAISLRVTTAAMTCDILNILKLLFKRLILYIQGSRRNPLIYLEISMNDVFLMTVLYC